MAEWISVNEKLPENISTVIVCVKEIKNPTTAWYGDGSKEWRLTEKDFLWIDRFTVTHWMPFPDPPAEEA